MLIGWPLRSMRVASCLMLYTMVMDFSFAEEIAMSILPVKGSAANDADVSNKAPTERRRETGFMATSYHQIPRAQAGTHLLAFAYRPINDGAPQGKVSRIT